MSRRAAGQPWSCHPSNTTGVWALALMGPITTAVKGYPFEVKLQTLLEE